MDGAGRQQQGFYTFGASNFSQKAWINSQLQKDDQKVNATFTSLQLLSQQTAASLEDLISQTLVRLPRTSLEVQRMSADAEHLAEKLEKIEVTMATPKGSGAGASKGTATAATNGGTEDGDAQHQLLHQGEEKEPEQEQEQEQPQDELTEEEFRELQNLQVSLKKLEYCKKILDEAEQLPPRIDRVDAMITKGTTTAAELDELAAEVSAIQTSLAKLQGIDPTFGTALVQKVQSFGTRLESSLERECLAALKQRDTTKGPSTFAALEKIGRSADVLRQYVSYLITDKKEAFIAAIRSGSGSGSGGKQHPAAPVSKLLPKQLTAAMQNMITTLRNDEKYFACLHSGDEARSKALRSSVLAEFFRLTTAQIQEVLAAAGSNAIVVDVYTSLRGAAELTDVHPYLTQIFEKLTANFARQEEAALATLVKDCCVACSGRRAAANGGATPSSQQQTAAGGLEIDQGLIDKLLAALDESAQRSLSFFPSTTFGPGVMVWNDCLSKVADAIASNCKSLGGGGSEATAAKGSADIKRGKLTVIFSVCTALENLRKDITSIVPQLVSQNPDFVRPTLFDAAQETISACITKAKSDGDGCLVQPIDDAVAAFASLSVWQGGKSSASSSASMGMAPTQEIQNLGEILMEMPIELEACGCNINDAQEWVTHSVYAAISNVLAAIGRLRGIRGRGAVSQLSVDLEYFQNVIAAVVGESEREVDNATATTTTPTAALQGVLSEIGKYVEDGNFELPLAVVCAGAQTNHHNNK